jgi:RNA polymerase sigma-70 factor (ECF subfamily)
MGNPNFSIEFLFRSHYARLCYFAFKLIDNQDTAEDIVQDCFLKLWRQKLSLEDELSTQAYLYQMVRNACFNWLRHVKVEKKYADNGAAQPVGDNEHSLEWMIKAEVLGEIHKAIDALPPGCRDVLKLAYFESLKNEEIAQYLGVSINTVKTQKARALKLLRMKLPPSGYLFLLFWVS